MRSWGEVRASADRLRWPACSSLCSSRWSGGFGAVDNAVTSSFRPPCISASICRTAARDWVQTLCLDWRMSAATSTGRSGFIHAVDRSTLEPDFQSTPNQVGSTGRHIERLVTASKVRELTLPTPWRHSIRRTCGRKVAFQIHHFPGIDVASLAGVVADALCRSVARKGSRRSRQMR